MEFKTDSKIFTELLNIVDTYNDIYNDGIISYMNLHAIPIIKTNESNKKNNKYKNLEDDYDFQKYFNEEFKKLNKVNKVNKVNNNELEKKQYDNEKDNLINIISNAILDSDYTTGLEILSNIKCKISNYLIAQILDNSPQADIIITKFSGYLLFSIFNIQFKLFI